MESTRRAAAGTALLLLVTLAVTPRCVAPDEGYRCPHPDGIPTQSDAQAWLQPGGPFDRLQHDEGEQPPSKMTARIDQLVREQMCEQDVVGLGLGIVWYGQVVYVKGYGTARGLGDGNPADDVTVQARRTRFRWASLSKSVTAVASLIATQETLGGERPLYDLDLPLDPAARGCLRDEPCHFQLASSYYLDWQGYGQTSADWPLTELPINDPLAQITPRKLLAHRAGVVHYRQQGPEHPKPQPPSLDRAQRPGFVWAVNRLSSLPFLYRPGSRYNYSTFGYNLAGAALDLAVEDQGGYWPFVLDKVARPAGMAYFHPDDVHDPRYDEEPWHTNSHRAEGYHRDAQDRVVPTQQLSDVSWKLPGGGFISTTADLALYAEALLNDTLLPRDLAEELWTPQRGVLERKPPGEIGYGLGFNIGIQSGERKVYHSGAQENARSYMLLFPDGEDPAVGKLGIVVMSNSEHFTLGPLADAVEVLLRNPHEVEELLLAPPLQAAPAEKVAGYPALEFVLDGSHRFGERRDPALRVDSPERVGEDFCD